MSDEDRVPFSNGTEVEMFTCNWCDRCQLNDSEGGGCDEFVFGVVVEEGWPDLLVEVPVSSQNPLGVVCVKFDPCADQPLPDVPSPTTLSRVVVHPDASGSYDE